ncbi:MAG: hypothetical protein WA840_06300 [Caulobacteraceae bacterium]
MRRSRLHKASIWPWLLWACVSTAILVAGLGFHPRRSQFFGYAGIVLVWLIQAIVAIVAIVRARRRAARGIVDMIAQPNPSKGEFA